MRGMVAGVALFASLLILATSGGCESKPDGSTVYRFDTNDYQVEYDGQSKRVTVGPGFVRMVRHPEDIDVSEGRLEVGRRDYGAVVIKDKISVVGGKVAVNGKERKAALP